MTQHVEELSIGKAVAAFNKVDPIELARTDNKAGYAYVSAEARMRGPARRGSSAAVNYIVVVSIRKQIFPGAATIYQAGTRFDTLQEAIDQYNTYVKKLMSFVLSDLN